MPELTDIAARLVDLARAEGAEEVAAMAVDGESIEASARDGAIEEVGRAEGMDVGLRVIVGRRQACVSASSAKSDVLAELAARVVAMAKESPEDPYAGLPEHDPANLPDLDLFDPTETDADTLREKVLAMDAVGREVAGVTKSEGAGMAWSRRRAALVQSNGFAAERQGSFWSASATMIAGEGLGMERDYAWTSARHREDLRDLDGVAREAAERAVARLAPRKPPTGAVPVLYEARLAGSILTHLLGAVNGAAVARGSSFLADRLGERVLPEGVDVIDDPLRPRGPGSRPFDGEGLPSRRTMVVEGGVLKTWLLDCGTARQLDMETTRSAAAGPGSPPRPSASNVTLSTGSRSRAEMVAGLGRGLLVTEMLGASINPNTGDYSRGASGFWIEDGAIAYPVSEATVAGNLKDMLRALEPASDDRPTDRAIASPSLLIEGLHVSGD